MGISEGYGAGKKIGVIGLGSIGTTHALALQKLGVESVQALRTNRGARQFHPQLQGFVTEVETHNGFSNMDGYIIANPTALHVNTFRQIIGYGKPIFIEKPAASNLQDLVLMKELAQAGPAVQIGFCLRFDELLVQVVSLVQNHREKIRFTRLEVGQYLPSWHPYTDYRQEYFSRTDLGGGAIRTLAHELDLAQWFFGLLTLKSGRVQHISGLEIDVDDCARLQISSDACAEVELHMDFLQKKPVRKGIFVADDCDIHYDFVERTLTVVDTDGQPMLEKHFAATNMYVDQMKAFLQLCAGEKPAIAYATLEESVAQLQLIELAEMQSTTNSQL